MNRIDVIYIDRGRMGGLWFKNQTDLDQFVAQLRPSVRPSDMGYPFGMAMRIADPVQWQVLQALSQNKTRELSHEND